MCRLLVFTANDMASQMKRLFFNQLMLQNRGEVQNDGAGISDGVRVYKSGLPYSDLGLQWLPNLNTSLPWIGHVRSASRGAEKPSAVGAHPFYFKNSGLIGAHNGFVTDMGESAHDEPNVDSFRALKDLDHRIVKRGTLDSTVLNDWIHAFGPYSEWCFALSYCDTTWVIRGIRPMYWIRLMDGYVFNTSYNSLALFTEWLGLFWPKQFNFSPIKEMPMHQAMRIDLSNKIKHINISARERAPEGHFQYRLENGQESFYKIEGV